MYIFRVYECLLVVPRPDGYSTCRDPNAHGLAADLPGGERRRRIRRERGRRSSKRISANSKVETSETGENMRPFGHMGNCVEAEGLVV